MLQAKIDFTGHFCAGLVFVELYLRAESCARNAHNRGEDLASLDVVVIDGLLTHECKTEVTLLHNVPENLGSSEALQFLVNTQVGEDMDT